MHEQLLKEAKPTPLICYQRLACRKGRDIRDVRNSGDTRLKHGRDRSMKDGQVRNWTSFRVAKTGQLRIPIFPCRLGHFEKIDLGTDFEKTVLNASALQGVVLEIPTRSSLSRTADQPEVSKHERSRG
jgi:hypothetical protein